MIPLNEFIFFYGSTAYFQLLDVSLIYFNFVFIRNIAGVDICFFMSFTGKQVVISCLCMYFNRKT